MQAVAMDSTSPISAKLGGEAKEMAANPYRSPSDEDDSQRVAGRRADKSTLKGVITGCFIALAFARGMYFLNGVGPGPIEARIFGTSLIVSAIFMAVGWYLADKWPKPLKMNRDSPKIYFVDGMMRAFAILTLAIGAVILAFPSIVESL